jgi:pilus assembly protein TadC
MIQMVMMIAYLCGFSFVLGLIPLDVELRPSLEAMGIGLVKRKRKQEILNVLRKIAKINKPICAGAVRRRLLKDLQIAHVKMSPEEFMLVKELGIGLILFITFPFVNAEFVAGWFCMGFVGGYMIPEFWLKGKIKRVKAVIVKELPDAIDLLGLCVNAGLDFMLSLKWVVEKSPPSVMTDELNTILQEINVGKTRRDAIKDLAKRYDLPDLSTFARTLIQADKMGTSVTEALNILSEDMRIARYRRGEQMALKAPLKMLVPLLLFIFPVVGILVAGPIMLDFIENNPFSQMGGG